MTLGKLLEYSNSHESNYRFNYDHNDVCNVLKQPLGFDWGTFFRLISAGGFGTSDR